MLNFEFLEKGLPILSPPHFVYDYSRKGFSCSILSTDHILSSDCHYFLRYWAIYALQLFVSKVVMS